MLAAITNRVVTLGQTLSFAASATDTDQPPQILSFTLTNAPSGANIPLVMQIGKWRRQITLPTVNACANNAVSASLTHLPRNQTDGDAGTVMSGPQAWRSAAAGHRK